LFSRPVFATEWFFISLCFFYRNKWWQAKRNRLKCDQSKTYELTESEKERRGDNAAGQFYTRPLGARGKIAAGDYPKANIAKLAHKCPLL
jgi:hypothetical protein